MGRAIVEAVRLENSGVKGPLLLCTEGFEARLSDEAKGYLQTTNRGDMELREVCWPIALFETATSLNDALLNEYGQFLLAALNLLKFFAGGRLEVYYLEFARLAIRSALLRFPDEKAALEKHIAKVSADISLLKFLFVDSS